MLIATDALSLVFIACFLFGLLFLLATAFLGGHGHAAGHAHAAPHIGAHGAGGMHGLHVGPHAATHATAHAGASSHAQGSAAQQGHGSDFSLLSFVNPTSVVLFLLGFGFFGYLFHNTTSLALPLDLLIAGVGGLIVAGLLLLMLARVFGNSEGETVQDVSDRTGMLGKVSITIPENGLGEIIYISPGGMRKSVAARSASGQRLERDQEVVVVNYQRGVADVETWDRFMNSDEEAAGVIAPEAGELEKLRALLDESDSTEAQLVLRKETQKE